jgi:alanine dehydrogenase
LNLATLPYGLALADRGLDALRSDAALRAGLNVLAGRITHPAVAQALGLGYVDVAQALGA